jgi:unsaturated chondroitin disaccharide hydrolase
VRDDLAFARQRLAETAGSVAPDRYPSHTEPSGAWAATGAGEWTSGFFPGSLWLAYEATGDPALRAQAQLREAGLRTRRLGTSGNDQGFKLLDSFGNGYRLTGEASSRRVVLRAARSLASRYGPAVGMTRSWGKRDSPRFTVIVDNLMNLELLFWAAKHGAATPPGTGWRCRTRCGARAITCAATAARSMSWTTTRGAGSRAGSEPGRGTRATRLGRGARRGRCTASRWRTGRPAIGLLAAARRAADWYLSHLPADLVPYWDFDAPGIPDAPRDSSAAAIAASGLLELAELDPTAAQRARYRAAAEATLASLASDRYLARGDPDQSILLHGTQDRPRGEYDTGLVFGDYYFIEALLRHRSPPRPPDTPELDVRARWTGGEVRARVRSDETGTIRAALLAGRGTARRLELDDARSAVLGRSRARLAEPGTAGLRIHPRRGGGAHVPGTRLCVVLTPAEGDAPATAVPVRLRGGPRR